MFRSKSEGKSNVPVQGQEGSFPSYLPFVLVRQSTDWARPTMRGRATCLTQSTASGVTVTQKCHHRHTQYRAWQMSGHPMAQSDRHIKSTRTVSRALG